MKQPKQVVRHHEQVVRGIETYGKYGISTRPRHEIAAEMHGDLAIAIDARAMILDARRERRQAKKQTIRTLRVA